MFEFEQFHPEFLIMMDHYTVPDRNRSDIRKYLSKQIDAIDVMTDAFSTDEIMAHIYSNPGMYHVNEFTSIKFRAAMFMVENDIHQEITKENDIQKSNISRSTT